MPNAPTGMTFSIQAGTGLPVMTQNFPDYGFTSEVAYPADWILVVTGCPAGATPAAVAALITAAPVALPLPFGNNPHWRVAYSALSGPITATAW